ncbi:DUF3306 domain-containing protein [Bradyrhizobium canariense]|uniref:DUF3306 domain-containing protein n=1 Tax=Bradyrhizobium canariense TaxID=255045 RepID=UPI000B8F71D6|nr:DUF3306 domain-containing protein [Bradyrhizobium canariense]
MTSSESFVTRWARLKRSSVPSGTEPVERTIAQQEIGAADDLTIEPANLPSIEAIDLNTDIRGFLQSGVPAELTRAALRQAWVSDPAIRDFIGIAENQWDFNDPEAMPGFGPLPEEYDVSGLLSQALGARDHLVESIPKVADSIQQSSSNVTAREPDHSGVDKRQSSDYGPLHLPEDGRGGEAVVSANDGVEADNRPQNYRRHGSALPRQGG